MLTSVVEDPRMQKLLDETPAENYRLDGIDVGFKLALKCMDKYDVIRHGNLSAREVFRQIDPNAFMFVKNAKAACWALDFLRGRDQ